VKVALITPIGTSAPVVTEMVMHLNGLEGLYLTDVVILPTQDETVKAHTALARAALRHRYPRIRVHVRPLPFRDIESTEDNVEFMRIAARVIQEERRVHMCERVYLSIAGGRKDICTSLAIIGQLVGSDGVFHVINPDVKVINEQLERIRDKIFELYHSPKSERDRVYERYRELFDSVMFPPIDRLRYIRIPVIPYPAEYLHRVVAILVRKTPVDVKEEDELGEMSLHDLMALESAGIIRIAGGKVAPTEFGRLIGRIWR